MIDAGAGPPAGSELVPGWLVRLAAVGWRLLVATALGLVLIYICVVLSTVTASILVAAIVAATFAPYVLALRNRGWSRIKAAAAVFLVAATVIIATLPLPSRTGSASSSRGSSSTSRRWLARRSARSPEMSRRSRRWASLPRS